MKLPILLNKIVSLVALIAGCALSACGGGSAASAPVAGAGTSLEPVPASTLPSNGNASSSVIVGELAGALTSLRIENTGELEQSSVPVTFGQVFAQGDIPALSTVEGKLSDGTTIPLQVSVKATHSDGSLRHAVISAIVPKLQIGRPEIVSLFKAALVATPPVTATPTDLVNANFTAAVNVDIAGQRYSASADALLKAGKYTTWIAGPVANEWLMSAPLKTAQGVEHPHLTARFAVRSFAGLNRAKVDVIIENGWAYEPGPQNFTYDAEVVVGGKTVYSKAALTHYHHARWRKTFWWGGAPEMHLRHKTAYLISTKAVPNYDQTLVISQTALTNANFVGPTTEPMKSGLAQPYMPTTGGRSEIGLLPSWSVMYLLSMDNRAKAATLGMGDLAGSWSSHYRDKKTDRPVSVVDYPYMTLLGHPGDTYNPVTKKYESFPACGGDCSNPNVADSSHQASFAYVPYMLTGDYFYLEELQFWAMWNILQKNPAYRGNVAGLLNSDQVRGQGWSMRTLGDATFITPDKDPLKAQFEKFLSNNLDWYNATYANNPIAANSLGALADDGAISYGARVGLAPWMDDFFTSAIGHLVELGYAKAKPLLNWKAKFPISRMAGPGFCWILGASYYLNVRDSATSPVYTTIGKVYDANASAALKATACGSSEMAAILSVEQSKPGMVAGEMTGYAYSATGFPSNMQPALAYGADSGVADGTKAWQIFMNRRVKPDYSSEPQFAIIPR